MRTLCSCARCETVLRFCKTPRDSNVSIGFLHALSRHFTRRPRTRPDPTHLYCSLSLSLPPRAASPHTILRVTLFLTTKNSICLHSLHFTLSIEWRQQHGIQNPCPPAQQWPLRLWPPRDPEGAPTDNGLSLRHLHGRGRQEVRRARQDVRHSRRRRPAVAQAFPPVLCLPAQLRIRRPIRSQLRAHDPTQLWFRPDQEDVQSHDPTHPNRSHHLRPSRLRPHWIDPEVRPARANWLHEGHVRVRRDELGGGRVEGRI